MFNQLFKDSSAVARHQFLPLAKEREQFLADLAQQGYKQNTLLLTAPILLRAARLLERLGKSTLGASEVQSAVDRFIREPCRDIRMKRWRDYEREALCRLLKQWLIFFGQWKKPALPSGPLWKLYRDFLKWLEEERGLSKGSLKNRRYSLLSFLRWWEEKKRSLSTLKINDLDDFLQSCHRRGLSRVGIRNAANAARSFLRYVEGHGLCRLGLADAFHGPTIYSQEGLPRGPLWSEVRDLLARLDTHRRSDIRNRAILMLFAIYGMRRQEVVHLRLDDIDWRNDTITIDRSKQRRRQTYPLLPSVGQAILRYLENVRPKTTHREVFLRLLAPVRPMSSTALWAVAAYSMDKAGVRAFPHRGPHSLRHACARRLMSEGFSLTQVGDHLGHRSADATRIYTKVDLAALREVANFDLGEVL